LRLAAAAVVMNCTIKANFKTFDPAAYVLKPLANARVKPRLQRSGDHGVCPARPMQVVICMPRDAWNPPRRSERAGARARCGVSFRGRSDGDVVPAGSHFIPFPIAAWSTKAGANRRGSWEISSSPATRFPPCRNGSSSRSAAISTVHAQYVAGRLEMAPYPQNIQVKLARTAGA